MEMNEVKDLVESRDMVYRGEFLQQLSKENKEEFDAGMRKVNLQPIDKLGNLNGEGCWAWIPEEYREEYDNEGDKVIKVILSNSPLEYMGIFFWGSELEVKCNGSNRPTLSSEWIREKILNANWFIK